MTPGRAEGEGLPVLLPCPFEAVAKAWARWLAMGDLIDDQTDKGATEAQLQGKLDAKRDLWLQAIDASRNLDANASCRRAPDGGEDEKATRIKYQTIVYDACTAVDAALGRRVTKGEGTTIDKLVESIGLLRAASSPEQTVEGVTIDRVLLADTLEYLRGEADADYSDAAGQAVGNWAHGLLQRFERVAIERRK